MVRRAWTTGELATLEEFYPKMPMPSLSSLLQRTASSIHGKAKDLGLRRSAEFWAGEHSGRVRSGESRGVATRFQKRGSTIDCKDQEPAPTRTTKRPWTQFEDAQLKRLYLETPSGVIANLIGRSRSAIRNRAKELKLKRSPAFWASEHSGRMNSGQRRSVVARSTKIVENLAIRPGALVGRPSTAMAGKC
jgi:hypothetical protein